jgi:predicted nucleic acid-binding Zn ribbon protein
MMSPHIYRVRPAFAVAVSFVAALLLILVVLAFAEGAARGEKIILCALFIPILYLYCDALMREMTLSSDGIRVKKLFGTKKIPWDAVTNADMMLLGRKAYLLISTTKGFHIVPNSYGDFASMVGNLAAHLDAEKVETRVREFVEKPVSRVSDVITMWLVVLTLLVVIVMKIV